MIPSAKSTSRWSHEPIHHLGDVSVADYRHRVIAPSHPTAVPSLRRACILAAKMTPATRLIAHAPMQT